MSSDLSAQVAQWGSAAEALSRLHAGCEEYDAFFRDVFARFESIAAEFAQQQKDWQRRQEEHGQELARQAALLREERDQLERQRAELAQSQSQPGSSAEPTEQEKAEAAARQARLNALFSRVEEDRAALRQFFETTAQQQNESLAAAEERLKATIDEAFRQQAGLVVQAAQSAQTSGGGDPTEALVEITAAIARLRDESAQTRSEIQRQRDQFEAVLSNAAGAGATADEAALQRLRQAEEERAAAAGEKAVLEAELDSIRGRAAELTEALENEKRQSASQQDQWREELQNQRLVLEELGRRMLENERNRPAAASVSPSVAQPAAKAAAMDEAASTIEAADSALESVMAQFEMLQRDVARRRGDAAKPK